MMNPPKPNVIDRAGRWIEVDAPILNHKEVIEKLRDSCVVGVYGTAEEGYWLSEEVDNCMTVKLSQRDCEELSELFAEMADNLKNESGGEKNEQGKNMD